MVHFTPALILALVAWLIKYRKVTWLIAGYNTAPRKQKERYDIEKLTRMMGNFIFSLAGVFALMGLASLLFPQQSEQIPEIGFLVFLPVIVIGLIYMNTGRRLLKD